ncbi:MAG: hypothetical protein LBP20_00445 [Treponema sp.]|jgi:hypothetical protein|nr:hypothetical protein [Treponema sp.]
MCWYCGAPVSAAEPIGRSLQCKNCGRDIRSCRNCRFYSPGSSGECREPQAAADSPRDRERANFCDWFSLNPALRSPGAGRKKEQDLREAKSAFDKLFDANG